MANSQRSAERPASESATDPALPRVNCRDVTDDRYVFVEAGNGDAWLATDFVVTPVE